MIHLGHPETTDKVVLIVESSATMAVDDVDPLDEFDRVNMCNCGSGESKEAQHDARGIFLTYTCPKCYEQKMGWYRADVLTDPNYWTDEPIEPTEG